MEHFGSAEVWALKLTPEWIGTDARKDLPLPANVRRYYIGSSNHGGGAGGFNSSLPGAGLPATGPTCPGNNYGTAVLPANPVPHTETVNALRVHFRNWVMRGTEPPPSRWPKLADGTLVPANKKDLGFPTLPQLRATIPEPDFIMPVIDYDWGARFNPVDGSGVADNAPPPIRQVLGMYAPKVDADGNELGSVPVVLLDAPLGTYLGWNVTSHGARPSMRGRSAITSEAWFHLPAPKRNAKPATTPVAHCRNATARMKAMCRLCARPRSVRKTKAFCCQTTQRT